ncbi:MAG TPA: hypothetical protein ENJ84_05960, partial [Gammaproteobacteria bacterium]|nr:hypothetical protein [Gammaproteobacteria bacterium]
MRNLYFSFLCLVLFSGFVATPSLLAADGSKSSLKNTPVEQARRYEAQKNYQQSADMYLKTAQKLSPPDSELWRVKAAEMTWLAGNLDQALSIIQSTDQSQLGNIMRARLNIVAARIARYRHDYAEVSQRLKFTQAGLPRSMQREILALQKEADSKNGVMTRPVDHVKQLMAQYGRERDSNVNDPLWNQLMLLPTQALSRWLGEESSPIEHGWVELAYIAKTASARGLNNALLRWEQSYRNHPAYPDRVDSLRQEERTAPVTSDLSRIAVLLPTSGPLAHLSEVVLDGVMAAKYHISSHSPQVRIYDTAGHEHDIEQLYQQAVADGADMVLGPMDKKQVDQLGQAVLSVPLLSLNYGNQADLYNPNLYEFALLPEDEARLAARKMAADGLTQVATITPNSRWGKRLRRAFVEEAREQQLQVVASATFESSNRHYSDVIKKAFKVSKKGAAVQVDGIFLAATPKQARLFKPLLRFHYLKSVPVYATSHVFSGAPDTSQDRDVNGILFTEIPWLLRGSGKTSGQSKQPFPDELDAL